MLKKLKTALSKTWEKIQIWTSKLSGWEKNGSIFFARAMTAVGGWLLTVGSFDWSPVWNLLTIDTGFSWKQILAVGGPVLVGGIVLEITRRRNADL